MFSLQSIAREMVEQLHLLKLFGAARMDSLLVEMLLGGEPLTGESLTAVRTLPARVWL